MKVHKNRRYEDEENVRHGVEELRDQRGEGVVLLAPVNRGAPPTQMAVPHL